MSEAYHPELDQTDLLSGPKCSMCQAFIGSGNWVVTLGWMDVPYAVNTLARFSMAPRKGHLKAAMRIFRYLHKKQKGMIVIDPTFRDWEGFPEETFDTWKEFYPDAEEGIPLDMPKAKKKAVRITVYVDADHAHDQVTQRSVTGIVLFINGTPVRWVSKRQKTVETST